MDAGFIVVSTDTPGAKVHTYVMLIDNISGDPIYMLPVLLQRPWPIV